MSALPNPKTKDEQAARASAIQRRRLTDHAARAVVTFGGSGIVLCILAILVFISLEVYPLWKGAKAELVGRYNLVLPQRTPIVTTDRTVGDSNTSESSESQLTTINGSAVGSEFPILALGVEEYKKIGYIVTSTGRIDFISLKDGNTLEQVLIEGLDSRQVTSAKGSLDNRKFTLGTSDGYVLPVQINFKVSFNDNDERVIDPEVVAGELIQVDTFPITHVAFEAPNEGTKAVAAVTSDGRLIFLSELTTRSLLGEEKKEQFKHDLTSQLNGNTVTAMALDGFPDNLYVGTKAGKIFHWDMRDKANPKLNDIIDATKNPGTAITALGFLIGDRSLIVVDEAGDTSTWFLVRDEESPGAKRLEKIHELASHQAPVTAIAASARDKGFLSADSKGNIILQYATSERKLLEIPGQSIPIKALVFAPKANGALAVDEKGTLYDWEIDNPHPETNWKALFGKVWYEGYDKPEYVWQSTGGTDDFEPKFSLTPLAYGTLKGTFYALLFAIPLAILGAICVSQFMHPSLKNTIKPIIEIMAALPSVVLGFLAGLWMAPLVEKIVPAFSMMPLVLTIMTLISVFLWRLVPKSIRGKFKEGTEFLLLIPVFFLGVQICLWLNGPVEALLLGGDYKAWLLNTLGLQFDQRNSLVVGFAMGFAVIPIIFTISEDSLSNVPKHLTSGSLALGATRWQTAIRVVLPTAAAGIFSAVMIGFGRAVGETMIVLMATGNTPVMDWSIFNGFRALSANIAVEIPEAPHGGTLYRILFLAALLLFLMTFILNTVAELVRIRLRKKYGQL
ncbi:MAG: ABC transporter permease subunit [Deltaproteobacteria bacterium]|nr:ABC transporter permease subunit [Deltaproteobacteria bacterium]